MNCKSISVIAGPPSFLLQPILMSLAILSCNYWLYDFNATGFHFFSTFAQFVLLVPFEILSRYPIIDGSQCFSKDVQWNIDKVFREKTYVLTGFNIIFSQFSAEFLLFACICCHFRIRKTYCDVLLITYALQTSLVHPSVFIDFR